MSGTYIMPPAALAGALVIPLADPAAFVFQVVADYGDGDLLVQTPGQTSGNAYAEVWQTRYLAGAVARAECAVQYPLSPAFAALLLG